MKKNAALLMLLFLLILLRIPSLALPPIEYQAWRQSDTEAIARNFAEYKFNLFYPQFNYDGPPPNYVQLELQLTTFLIAILYKLFGYDYILARLVPLGFFLGSGWFLYLLANKIYQARTAFFALLLYGIMPLGIFISRAIMPEAAALFFYLGSLYYSWNWLERDESKGVLLPSLFTALAILEKLPAALILAPIFALACRKFGFTIFKQRKLWIYGLVSILPPLLYYFAWLPLIAQTDYVTGIAWRILTPEIFLQPFAKGVKDFFSEALPRLFTYPVLFMTVYGLFFTRDEKELALLNWTYAVLLEYLLIVSAVQLDYYLVFGLPLGAIWGAKCLNDLSRRKAGYVLIGLLIFLILRKDWDDRGIYYQVNTVLLQEAATLQIYTKKEDLLVIGTPEPQLLNLARRMGWRAGIESQEPALDLALFINQGARYYVTVSSSNQETKNQYEKYVRYLDERYTKIKLPGGDYLYKLQP